MAVDDFDTTSLADYLHTSVAAVIKMAERGQLPGRKVGGQWRFAPGEIHHWLERRIGALDDSELLQLEGALERSAPASQQADNVTVTELLRRDAIAIPLLARTRSSVISAMVDLAASTDLVWDPPALADAIRQREDMHPTALENGVALLHPRRPMSTILAEPLLAFGRTERGIPFGSERGALTDLFFLICSVDDQGHLRSLARLSRLIADPTFLAALRAVPDPVSALEVVTDYEQRLAT
jgi:PTS system nitrogen regulatory IIA component